MTEKVESMKKELEQLFKINGELEINNIFKLRHSNTDYEGKPVDWLYLEAKSINGSTRYFKSIEIISRDTNGIIDEVKNGIEKIMNEIRDDMCKRWSGGIIGRISAND